MKFIDEKGRLFGKINVIDFLIILFFLCILPVFYFGYHIILKRYMVLPQVFIETEINCKFIKVRPVILKLVKVGDREIDKDGSVRAEIIWLGEVKPHEYEFNIGDIQKITKTDQELKDIFVKVRLKAEVKDKKLYYKGNLINADIPINFSTGSYTLEAIPAVWDTHNREEIYIEIDCKFIKVRPEILKLVKIGDKEVNKSGASIAEIVWLGDVKPHEYEFDIGGGQKITKTDQELKDILAKVILRAEVEVRDNTLFYKNERFLLNFPVEFKMQDYSLEGIPIVVSRKESLKEKWVEVKVKLTGISPDLRKVIKEKDEERDSTDRVVGILRKVINDKPSEVLIVKTDEFATLNHPYLRDIDIALDVLCIEKEGVLYFKNYPVKIGNTVMFTTGLYSVNGQIIGLEIK